MKDNTFRFIISILIVSGFTASAVQGTGEDDIRVKSREIGALQYEVTCFESATYCAEEFKRLCPAGHRVGGYFRNEYDHGQITAIITCNKATDE